MTGKKIVKTHILRKTTVDEVGKYVEYTGDRRLKDCMGNYEISAEEYNALGQPERIIVVQTISPYKK